MKVAVIMSTYNGEKYISEQIDSILTQNKVEVELFIRDDGSTDNTINIIGKYVQIYDNVHLSCGNNLGFRRSFIEELMQHDGFPFYAFCDQDDFWEAEKLSAAVDALSENNDAVPCLYYSNLKVSDEQLKVYRVTNLDKRKKTLESIIMRRSIAGCTMVFNYKLWEYLHMSIITDQMLLRGHDSFLLSLCYGLGGHVICDKNAYIRYRQHGANTSGSSNGVFARIKKEWNVLSRKKGTEPEIARSIINEWRPYLDNNAIKTLELVQNFSMNPRARIVIFFSPKFTTGDLRLTLLGKVRVLLGLL